MAKASGRRNLPCACGSGKKYKQCCGRTGPRIRRLRPESGLRPLSFETEVESAESRHIIAAIMLSLGFSSSACAAFVETGLIMNHFLFTFLPGEQVACWKESIAKWISNKDGELDEVELKLKALLAN